MRASFWATLRTLSFHISCAVSAVIAVFETAITAITAVYVFVFFSKQANPHNRFFFYRLCRFASLSYILITSLPRTSYTLSLALFHMSVESRREYVEYLDNRFIPSLVLLLPVVWQTFVPSMFIAPNVIRVSSFFGHLSCSRVSHREKFCLYVHCPECIRVSPRHL